MKVSFCAPVQEDKEKSGTAEAEKDVDKKEVSKPQKKTKISEDVSVELIMNDVLDPTAEDVASSKKK